AEDGIRDRNVTGVQTCALPIYRPNRRNCVRSTATNTASKKQKTAASPVPAHPSPPHFYQNGVAPEHRLRPPPPTATGPTMALPRSEERRVGKAHNTPKKTTQQK